jgi:hypothetical protein
VKMKKAPSFPGKITNTYSHKYKKSVVSSYSILTELNFINRILRERIYDAEHLSGQ